MGIRGRQSIAALSVVRPDGIEKVARPSAPTDLTADQAGIWREIVNSLAAEWFRRETWRLLKAYCRHADANDKIAQLIDTVLSRDELDVEEYDRLLKMQERESRAMSSLATRMRITQQSTYDKSKKKPLSHKKLYEED